MTTTPSPADWLRECLALLEKATLGQWQAGSCDGGWDAVRESGGQVLCKLSLNHPANADAIAAAVNFLRDHGPALATALRLREGCESRIVEWRQDSLTLGESDGYGAQLDRCADDLARILE